MTITTYHTTILTLLYRFRFLERQQIQILIGHNHSSRVSLWLRVLVQEGYIRRFYNQHQVTVAAQYSLGLKGRKYLKQSAFESDEKVLNRVWREKAVSAEFRRRCIRIADIFLSLLSLVKETQAELKFWTKTDLYNVQYLVLPHPDAYFSLAEKTGRKQYYFLDLFDELTPRMVLRKRVRQYLNYHEAELWQDETGKAFPNVILVFSDEHAYKYCYKQIQKLLADDIGINFYLATWEQVKVQGLSRAVLKKVTLAE